MLAFLFGPLMEPCNSERGTQMIFEIWPHQRKRLLITGFQGDPIGGDGGHQYVQMLATKDIDFTLTPYSIIFNNNAGTASSATPLDAGGATGG